MKINITSALISKLNILSSEYNVEVGGYLTGEIRKGEIYLDGLLIPNQLISSVTVSIHTNNQVELFRKYGKKCKRIIGHWHSHHSMGCGWSQVDERNMSNIMEYHDLFIFIVSSMGNHKVKMCMKKPFTLEIDDCDLHLRTVMIDQLRTQMQKLMNNKADTTEKQMQNLAEKADEIEEADKIEEADEIEEVEESQIKSEHSYYG